jgi:hypothetical protein
VVHVERRRPVVAFLAVLLALGAAGGVVRRSGRARSLLTSAAARWREMHTAGAGRARALPHDVAEVVAILQAAGVKSFRFSPALEENIDLAPFVVEAAWPIHRTKDGAAVVGYATELAQTPACTLIGTAGKLALGHCRP